MLASAMAAANRPNFLSAAQTSNRSSWCPRRFFGAFRRLRCGRKDGPRWAAPPMAERVGRLPQRYPAGFITRLAFGRFVRPSVFAQPASVESRFARRPNATTTPLSRAIFFSRA